MRYVLCEDEMKYSQIGLDMSWYTLPCSSVKAVLSEESKNEVNSCKVIVGGAGLDAGVMVVASSPLVTAATSSGFGGGGGTAVVVLVGAVAGVECLSNKR